MRKQQETQTKEDHHDRCRDEAQRDEVEQRAGVRRRRRDALLPPRADQTQYFDCPPAPVAQQSSPSELSYQLIDELLRAASVGHFHDSPLFFGREAVFRLTAGPRRRGSLRVWSHAPRCGPERSYGQQSGSRSITPAAATSGGFPNSLTRSRGRTIDSPRD